MSNAPTAARAAFGDIAPANRISRQCAGAQTIAIARNGSQPSADWKKVYGPDILNQQGKLYRKPACNV